jgi:hypothetical protein
MSSLQPKNLRWRAAQFNVRGCNFTGSFDSGLRPALRMTAFFQAFSFCSDYLSSESRTDLSFSIPRRMRALMVPRGSLR